MQFKLRYNTFVLPSLYLATLRESGAPTLNKTIVLKITLNISLVCLNMESKINWSLLKTPKSNAREVPKLIARLIAPFAEQRNRAQFSLEWMLFDHNHIYDSAYYSVGLIVDLLRQEYTVDRKSVFDLLIELSFCRFLVDEMILQETGERIKIYPACMDKLKALRPVIADAVAKTEIEIDLKELLLDLIDGTFFIRSDAEQ